MELQHSCWTAAKPGTARPDQEPTLDDHMAGWVARGWSLSGYAVNETPRATGHHFVWARSAAQSS